MVKYLPLGVALLFMVGVLIFLRMRIGSPAEELSNPVPLDSPFVVLEKTKPSPTMTVAPTIKKDNPVQTLANTSTGSGSDPRINNLEKIVADLQGQIDDLKATPSPAGTTSSKPPLYIPLGSGGSSSALDWTTIDTFQITLDPGDYPGYSGVQLEVSLRTFQGNGQAFVRLLDVDGGAAILSSQISSNSGDYTWVSSGKFTLPSGKKKYKLQLKTLTGYEAGIQNARLKISF